MDQVTPDNCPIQHLESLYLPTDTVSHKPDIQDVNINPVFPNRTALLHLHNMALTRAFFWSYVLQSRFIRPAINDTYDPGMLYYFLSTVADVAANPKINASSVYFSPNSSYSPSFRGFFNKTFPLFAPRTFRADDFNDPIHLERISTLNTFEVRDLGAIPPDSLSLNYTSEWYRTNEWYRAWLPDDPVGRHDTKTTYQVQIRYANNTNETFTFHGPPGADEQPGPVKWLRPYFDCSRSNKWLLSVAVPVADIYPRHTQFRHIEYPTYTAATVLEMDFDRIDINQCPRGQGNDGENRFADTSRCRKDTTECEPLHGYGFRRGAYQCRCRPGFRLPNYVRRPYLGEIIERATQQQYHSNFACEKVGWIQKLPVQWDRLHPIMRQMYLDQNENYKNFSWEPGATMSPNDTSKKQQNVDATLMFIASVKADNCHLFNPRDLILQGDVGYGSEFQFESEALMAVRLANFISGFMQIVVPTEIFPGKRLADKPLSEDQMMAETLSIVMGSQRIWAAGTFWERGKFTNRTLFAPYAFKTALNTRKFRMEDLARLNSSAELYLNKEWYRLLKTRWSTNFDDLERHYLKMHIRNNETGDYMRKYEQYPTSYRAANLGHGQWTSPYFDCGGRVPKWVITYASPFFGWDSLRSRLEYKGAVTVTMDLMKLDINQCPDKYYVQNAFKNTHKCDRHSSYCVPIQGREFDTGGYKCDCLQGYEYPFEDATTYFDGQVVEAEFLNVVMNNKSRFDTFKCRLAGAANIAADLALLLALLGLAKFL